MIGMTNNDIIKRLDLLIADGNEQIVNELNERSDLINDFSYESLSLVQLIVAVEEEFKMVLPDELLLTENLRSYSWWKSFVLDALKLRDEVK